MSSIGSFVLRAFRRYRKALAPAPRVPQITRKEIVFCVGGQDFAVLDKVLEPGDYDISFVTSIETAYSEIANAMPGRVILCMRADDEQSLLVLSMLSLDPRTQNIPVITCVAGTVGALDEGADGDSASGLAPTRPGVVMH
jgi:hypothetical protein